MTVYFKTQEGNMFVEKGRILTLGGTKKHSILTGNNRMELEMIGNYKTEKEATEVFNSIVEKIIRPTTKEIEAGIIYIDLKYLLEIMEINK